MLPEPVLTVNRNSPSWLISTQHGAAWPSADAEPPMHRRAPPPAGRDADTAPAPAALWAFETNSWYGLVGRNSLPNGPTPWAANGDPGAGIRRPSKPTRKLSLCAGATSVPASLVPVELNRTSPGWAVAGSDTVEP